jgi:hydroxyacylglutathione hydrolase
MLQLHPIPAFSDNYLWAFTESENATKSNIVNIIDPGSFEAVLAYLEATDSKLGTILLTHHHADHTGGVEVLRQHYEPLIYAPSSARFSYATHHVEDGDTFNIGTLKLSVITVPGHTLDHCAYFLEGADSYPVLFCGDTLFSAGCGRVFEGSMEQMYESLQKLTKLPLDTRICCAHEYTLNNLRFALAVEPTNQALLNYREVCEKLRRENTPTLPTTLEIELAINPFLRCHVPEVKAAVEKHGAQELEHPVEVFSCLRSWKDNF